MSMRCMKKKIVRAREGRSLTDWLVSGKLQAENKTGLADTKIFMPFASNEEFSLVDDIDKISKYGSPVIPDATIIQAERAAVWQIITDFDAYSEWNPLQTRISIYESGEVDGNIQCELNAKYFGIVEQEVLYLDEERFIFIYGKKGSNFRAQWLTNDGPDGATVYHSFDCLQLRALPLAFVKCFLVGMIRKLFDEQHQALKKKAEEGI